MSKPSLQPETDELLEDILLEAVEQGYWMGVSDGDVQNEPLDVQEMRIVDKAKAQLNSLIAKERLDELRLLADFLKSAHLYDQDAAMKLRYHFNERIAELEQELNKKEGI